MSRIHLFYPDVLFVSAFFVAIIIGAWAGFHSVSLSTYILVFQLFLVLLILRMGIIAGIKGQSSPLRVARFRVVLLWIAGGLLLIGSAAVIYVRIRQLSDFPSVQYLRMAIIMGDIDPLPFPLSNVQSLSHALGLVLFGLSKYYAGTSAKTIKNINFLAYSLLSASILVALIEGNRAALIIIGIQIFLILGLLRELPSILRLSSIIAVVLIIFFVLQIAVRQSGDMGSLGEVFELALRNVASYLAGGVVAFDRVYSGIEPNPPYLFPVKGFIGNIFFGVKDGDDLVLPFVWLGDTVFGNVFTALFYLKINTNPFLGVAIFGIIGGLCIVSFRLARRSMFALIMASYLGVSFVLWPLSEYVVALLPLVLREILVYLLIKLFVLRRVRSVGFPRIRQVVKCNDRLVTG